MEREANATYRKKIGQRWKYGDDMEYTHTHTHTHRQHRRRRLHMSQQTIQNYISLSKSLWTFYRLWLIHFPFTICLPPVSFIPIIYNIPIFILRACACVRVCVFVSHMMIISVSIVASFSIQSIKIKRRQEKWWLLNFYFIVSTDIIYDLHSIRCWTLDNCSFPIWNIFEPLFFVVCKFSTANQFDSLFFAIFCFVFFLAVEMCARIDWHFVRYGNVIKYASVQKKKTHSEKK